MNEASLPSDWTEVTVEEIKASHPTALATGPFGSSISSKYFQEGGIPVIRGSNLSDDVGIRLDFGDLVFLAPEKAAEFRRSAVRKGDLVFTCWGTIGQVGLIEEGPFPEYIISNKQMKLTPDSARVDSEFLYYLFSGPEVSGRIRSQMIGSSVPGFNLTQLRSLYLRLPPLNEQVAIGHMLGTLDTKIKADRRINSTLETMARAIFKSWFVDFDPVRERHPLFPRDLVASALGQIPEGWGVGVLGDIAQNHRRGIAPAEVSSGTAYIGLEHMPRRSIALGQWEDASGLESNKFRFFRGEILFGKLRPYFHKVGVAAVDGICSTDILVVAPRQEAYFGFALALVSSEEFVQYTDRGSAGTKMPRTNWSDMARYRTVIPPEPVAHAFTETVTPMVEKIAANIHESRTLAALRDALLPKLLSGEIRVKQAEKIVGEAV